MFNKKKLFFKSRGIKKFRKSLQKTELCYNRKKLLIKKQDIKKEGTKVANKKKTEQRCLKACVEFILKKKNAKTLKFEF